MKKVIKLTENDLMRIVKRVINENMESKIESNVEDNKEEAKDVIKQILTPDEIEFLGKLYQEEGERNFKQDIKQAAEDVKSMETGDLTEEEFDNMSDEEYKLRSIVDKIITKGSVIAALGIVPAAMFVSGGAAAGLGVAAFLGMLFKDAAWWKRGGYDKYQTGHNYRQSNRSRMR